MCFDVFLWLLTNSIYMIISIGVGCLFSCGYYTSCFALMLSVIICMHVTCWGNLPEILLNPADNDHEDDPYKMSARAHCPRVSPTFEIRKKGTRSNILLRLSHAEKYYDIKVKKVFILTALMSVQLNRDKHVGSNFFVTLVPDLCPFKLK